MWDTVLQIWNKILTSNLFNFVLMLFFLSWVIKKFQISEKLEAGRKNIENEILLAKKEKENSVKALFETQEKGADIEKESINIIEKSAKNAVIVGEKLIDDAKNLLKTFSESTEKTINTNTENLRLNITNETAQKAIELAEKRIKNILNEDRNLHIKYINESIESLKGIDL